ncbi:MAG: transcriptional regulator [Nitrososphaerales archaeon]
MTEKEEKKILDLTSEMYKAILERGETGILQSELWKKVGLTSRDGSRIAIRLEKRGMIKREKILDHGRWTYRLIPLRYPVQFGPIEKLPCLNCPYDVQCTSDGTINPMNCPLELQVKGLADWVLSEYEAFELKPKE